jgi:hypothetical protein
MRLGHRRDDRLAEAGAAARAVAPAEALERLRDEARREAGPAVAHV